MFKKRENDFKIFIIVMLLVEIILFIILKFTVNKNILQGVIGSFGVIKLLLLLFFFISFRRSRVSLSKSKNPIKVIGEDIILKYYENAKEVNLDDLIKIKKAENIKKILWILFGLLITTALILFAIYL